MSGGLRFFGQSVELDHRVQVDAGGPRVTPAVSDVDDSALLQELQRDIHLRERELLLSRQHFERRSPTLRGRLLHRVGDLLERRLGATMRVATTIAAAAGDRADEVAVFDGEADISIRAV